MAAVPVNQRRAPLNDGNSIPVCGLGTFRCTTGEVYQQVLDAYKIGVRHIDSAQFYVRSELEVGQALKELAATESGFKRSDLFITGKVWNTHHRPDNVERAFAQSLKDLGTDYMDLYLIHWPISYEAVEDPDKPGYLVVEPQKNGQFMIDSNVSLVDTWKAMIKLRKSGKVKSIGVSNFSPKLIQMLIDGTGVPPAVIQVEAHPFLLQQELIDFCKPHKIHVSAYMPFGGDASFSKGGLTVLKNPVVNEIAQNLGKDVGQVLASWGIKRGYSVLPKSVKPSRIASNFQVFDLDDESYERICDLGRKNPERFGGLPFQNAQPLRFNVFDTPEERAANLAELF